jgi:hypothetical protein
MRARIEAVQISCGGGGAYWEEARALADLYGALLGMERYEPGYMKIAKPDGSLPEIGFEGDNDSLERRPRWPDPDHPQQVHLDIEVADLDADQATALRLGATKLQDFDDHRVFADHVGHPFCLFADAALGDGGGRIARIVFDCFSPRALASFYQELLDMPTRVLDSPERVVIAPGSGSGPMLAFQHAVFTPARWPDPAYPAQLHLDLSFEERTAGISLLERLGAIRLASKELHVVYADPASHPFCVSEPAPADWRAEQWKNRPRDG